MKVTLLGYTQDLEAQERVRFEGEVELPAVPRVGDVVVWNTRLRSHWRVETVYWHANTSLVQVNVQ